MKGVILAGGKGTRLGKLTAVQNKHLVAVCESPMIEYPLSTLKKIYVDDITIVTGDEHAGTVMQYLTQIHPETDFTYKVQKGAGGIAHALARAENICKNSNVAVILGDNIFENNFYEAARQFDLSNLECMLFLKEVPDPERFGVAEIKDDKIISIEEKPKNPKSNLAVTGLYIYNSRVFDIIKSIKPSNRGELEITDVNNIYLENERTGYHIINGFWSDAGTHESRKKAEKYIYEVGIDNFLC